MLFRNLIVGLLTFVFAVVVDDGTNDAFAQRRLFGGQGIQIGGPNGVQIGGGEGLRFGPPGIGVQYGGGQILRYGTTNAGVRIGGGEGFRIGTPNIGVQYGGGQGVRYGTPNIGVQYGGGQGVRYGTPNAGVQYGGGEGVRYGTPNAGIKYGGGEGIRYGVNSTGRSRLRSFFQGQPARPPAQPGALQNNPTPTLEAPAPTGGQGVSPTPAKLLDTSSQNQTNNNNFASGAGPGQIVLRHPGGNRAVEYTANGTRFRIKPGDSVYFAVGQQWKIGLTGSNGKVTHYDLNEPGQYVLGKSQGQWTIQTPSVKTTSAENPTLKSSEPTPANVSMDAEGNVVEEPRTSDGNTKSVLELGTSKQ